MGLKRFLRLCIYKIAPIKQNRYVFTSFNGHYSDNTKAISTKLHEVDKNAEIIWLVKKIYEDNVPQYIKTVNIESLKSYWYRGTAQAQIDNIYGFRAYFKTNDNFLTNMKMAIVSFLTSKKNQPIFATMHGTPLKKIGRDQVGNVVLDMVCSNSYLIVGDEFTSSVLKRVTFDKMDLKVLGSPRNDVLFFDNSVAVKNKLCLPKDKKIILFAPTFRNDGIDVEDKNIHRSGLNQLAEMNFDLLFKTLSQTFGGDWIMVCRFHYHVASMVDWEELNNKYPGKFVNGNQNDDMAEYLVCSDVLLSDSSSCMFDFCHMKKPCFIYFPDLEFYRDEERGFYLDINQLPFAVASDFDSLISNIRDFDQGEYCNKVDELLKFIGTQNDGNASARVINYIFEKCKK